MESASGNLADKLMTATLSNIQAGLFLIQEPAIKETFRKLEAQSLHQVVVLRFSN
jgi:hypothetical protein